MRQYKLRGTELNLLFLFEILPLGTTIPQRGFFLLVFKAPVTELCDDLGAGLYAINTGWLCRFGGWLFDNILHLLRTPASLYQNPASKKLIEIVDVPEGSGRRGIGFITLQALFQFSFLLSSPRSVFLPYICPGWLDPAPFQAGPRPGHDLQCLLAPLCGDKMP